MPRFQEGTSIPTVTNQIHKLISDSTVGMAESGLDVGVYLAMPASGRGSDDVYVGDIREWTQEITQSRGGRDGRHKRDESYFLDINIFITRQDVDEANAQAWRIWNVIDGILAENPDLQLDIPTLVVGQNRTGMTNMTYDEQDRGWRSRIHMNISVTTKLG